MTKFTNAQSAAAAWWINFLKTQGIVDFVEASEHAGRMRLAQRIQDALNSPEGDGKVRLAHMPNNGLTFLLRSALRNPRIHRKQTCVFMELCADYVHVTVDDTEQLVWRQPRAIAGSVIPGHSHRPAHRPDFHRHWPLPVFGMAELLPDGVVAIRSFDVLSPDEQHTRYCQADGCRCDSASSTADLSPDSVATLPHWRRYMLAMTPDHEHPSRR